MLSTLQLRIEIAEANQAAKMAEPTGIGATPHPPEMALLAPDLTSHRHAEALACRDLTSPGAGAWGRHHLIQGKPTQGRLR